MQYNCYARERGSTQSDYPSTHRDSPPRLSALFCNER